jgi:DNA polymerase I-like protein with 3'-5' exonuclease and polymerase domains
LHAYGKTSYGLNWSEDEATEARRVWFELFVEVNFWHKWMAVTSLYDRNDMMVKDPYTHKLKHSPHQKVWRSTTLTNREVYGFQMKDIMNYSDQGTGADMLLMAIHYLPASVRGMIINLIHDELLLQVPTDRKIAIAKSVEQAMLRAADDILLPYGIPTTVDGEWADVWKH